MCEIQAARDDNKRSRVGAFVALSSNDGDVVAEGRDLEVRESIVLFGHHGQSRGGMKFELFFKTLMRRKYSKINYFSLLLSYFSENLCSNP